jgi:hypothetical protein
MRSSICLLLVAAAAIALPGTAAGYTCYLVYDRNGNTIYQAMSPPVDMSDRGKAEREALRNRGELLLIIDTERCAPLTYVMGSGGGTHAINFDNALASVPEALPSTMGSGAPARQGSGTASSRPAAPAATGSSATKPYGK